MVGYLGFPKSDGIAIAFCLAVSDDAPMLHPIPNSLMNFFKTLAMVGLVGVGRVIPINMKRYRHSFLAVITVIASICTLNARGLKNWSYQELLDKSDLVAIATPVSTKDTKETWVAEASPIGCAAIGIETLFNVSAILKGDKSLKEIILHYYKIGFSPYGIGNGPLLLSIDLTQKNEYLVFLVKEEDCRYAPTVGQVDPGWAGIYKLH